MTRDGSGAKELYAEAASAPGPAPFTLSTALAAHAVSSGATVGGIAGVVTKVPGSAAGLYGGTLNNASCDRERQISYLAANPEKAAAFAGVLGIGVNEVASYVRGLTPVLLLADTRVTNHGYVDGHATSRQSVLQAGTAVLVDRFGTPRVRCACGNPLTEPQSLTGDITTQGETWSSYNKDRLTAVSPASQALTAFELVDVTSGDHFTRPAGSTGDKDGAATSGTCAQQPDDAISNLLAARRGGDRQGMSKCANSTVVDYFFGLADSFAAQVTASACRPPAQLGLTTEADAACVLSTTAIILLDKRDDGVFYAIGVVLVQQTPRPTPSASPTASPASCGTGAPEFQATRPAEQALVRFFRALGGQDYQTAYTLLSSDLQQGWVSLGPSADGLANFRDFYKAHLRCVTVTSITVVVRDDPTVSASLGIQWYEVQFDAEYISPLPAGSGKLQPYYRVHADPHTGAGAPPVRITGEATG